MPVVIVYGLHSGLNKQCYHPQFGRLKPSISLWFVLLLLACLPVHVSSTSALLIIDVNLWFLLMDCLGLFWKMPVVDLDVDLEGNTEALFQCHAHLLGNCSKEKQRNWDSALCSLFLWVVWDSVMQPVVFRCDQWFPIVKQCSQNYFWSSERA